MRSHFYLLDMTAFRLSPRFFRSLWRLQLRSIWNALQIGSQELIVKRQEPLFSLA